MSQFCTSCGSAQEEGKEFCTSCGNKMSVATAPIQHEVSTASAESTTPEVGESKAKAPKPRALKVLAAVVVLGGVLAGSYVLGRSSIDQEKIRKSGYDAGYSTGRDDGYDSGDSAGFSRGYSSGKTAGCEWVFDQANYASYVTKYDIYGYGFGRFPGSVYVSKSNC